ncbi:MAG: hypothetical protein C0464_04590 [Cyanobacteria bacterium DS2.008]|nr:hypothetical protein [Cyanobacteria bacterium DS2.008]
MKTPDQGKIASVLSALRSSKSESLPVSMTMDLWTSRVMLIAGIFLLLITAWRLLTIPAIHPLTIAPDQSMFVAIGELILQGKRPYVDFFDVNPPLAFYAHIAPNLVSHYFGTTQPQAFWYTTIALWIYSIAFSFWLLWRQPKNKESFVFMPLILSFSYLTLFLSGEDEFGQREHIFVLLFLPLFIVRWLRWQNASLPAVAAIVAAILASIGLYMKPSYLLAAIVLEALWLRENRQWRCLIAPETIICALFGLAYAGFLLAMPQDMKNGYFGMMVPVFTLGYGEYGTSLMFQLMGWGPYWKNYFLLLTYTSILGLILSRYSTLIMPLLAFSLFGLASYLMQGQPWLNHAIPFLAGAYMLAGVEAAILLFILRQFVLKFVKVFDAMWLSAICLWQFQVNHEQITTQKREAAETPKLAMMGIGYIGDVPKRDLNDLALVILKYTEAGEPVLFLTRSITPGYPLLLQTKRQPASRYLHAMLLPTTIFARDVSKSPAIKAKMNGFKTKILAEYKEDIANNKPKLIFVQATRIYDILKDADFLKTAVQEDYQYCGTIDDHRIYVRKDLPDCPAAPAIE